MENADDSETEIFYMQKYLTTYLLDDPSIDIASMIKSHPCNGLHTCKMKHEDYSNSEIVKKLFQVM